MATITINFEARNEVTRQINSINKSIIDYRGQLVDVNKTLKDYRAELKGATGDERKRLNELIKQETLRKIKSHQINRQAEVQKARHNVRLKEINDEIKAEQKRANEKRKAQEDEIKLAKYHAELVINSKKAEDKENKRVADGKRKAQEDEIKALRASQREYQRLRAAGTSAFQEITYALVIVSRQLTLFVSELVSAAANLETYRASINAVTRDSQVTADIMERLLEVTVELVGVDTSDLVNYTARLLATGRSADEAISAISGVTKALAEQGRGAAETRLVLEQVVQAINAGTVDMRDFRTILQRIPSFFRKASEALGENIESIEEYREAVERAGGPTEALITVLDHINETSRGADLNTLNAQLDILQDSSRVLAAELGEGLAAVLVVVLKGLNALIQAVRDLPQFVKSAIGIVAGFTAVITSAAAAMGLFIIALSSVATSIATLNTSFGGIGAAIAKLTNLVRAFLNLQLAKSIFGLANAFRLTTFTIPGFIARIALLSTGIVALIGSLFDLLKIWNTIARAFSNIEPIDNATQTLKDFNIEASESGRAFGITATEISNASRATSQAMRGLLNRMDNIRSEIIQITNTVPRSTEAWVNQQKALKALREEYASLSKEITNLRVTDTETPFEEQVLMAEDRVIRASRTLDRALRGTDVNTIRAAESDLKNALEAERDLLVKEDGVTATDRLRIFLQFGRDYAEISRKVQEQILKIQQKSTADLEKELEARGEALRKFYNEQAQEEQDALERAQDIFQRRREIRAGDVVFDANVDRQQALQGVDFEAIRTSERNLTQAIIKEAQVRLEDEQLNSAERLQIVIDLGNQIYAARLASEERVTQLIEEQNKRREDSEEAQLKKQQEVAKEAETIRSRIESIFGSRTLNQIFSGVGVESPFEKIQRAIDAVSYQRYIDKYREAEAERLRIARESIRVNLRQQIDTLRDQESEQVRALNRQFRHYQQAASDVTNVLFALGEDILSNNAENVAQIAIDFVKSSVKIIAQAVIQFNIQKTLSNRLRDIEIANAQAVADARNQANAEQRGLQGGVQSLLGGLDVITGVIGIPDLRAINSFIQNFARLFHDPYNDAAARRAGYQTALQQSPVQAGRQSAGDVIRETNKGIRQGFAAVGGGGANGQVVLEPKIYVQLPSNVVREVAYTIQNMEANNQL